MQDFLATQERELPSAITEQTLDALAWLGDQIPGGLFVYHAEEPFGLIYSNHAVYQIFGCATREEFMKLTGYTFRGMVHPDDFVEIQSSIDRQIADSSRAKLDYVEYRILRKDGTVRWVDDYGHLAHLPEYGNVYYVFISDATDKRDAQERQHEAELELAEEHHAREVRQEFLFNLSHDIRTPMNAIVGYSELAMQHRDDPALLADYLGKTISSSQQLLGLIDDMLEMSRIDSQLLELKSEPTVVAEQLLMVVDLFRIEADRRGVALEVDLALDDRQVMVDQPSLRRVVSNLLSNAVRFTPAGGRVRLQAWQDADTGLGAEALAPCAPSEDSERLCYHIRVSDTGVGMSPEFMERMYEAFVRESSSTTSGVAGTGLGLTIAKRLLDAMGGSIAAESEKGVGTTFSIDLSLHRIYEDSGADGTGDTIDLGAEAAGDWRILVVEDIELNRMLVEDVLEEVGFSVECAENGLESVVAVQEHEEWYYDLILMDIQMPVMNGYDATRAIRALPRHDAQRIPIVALSANAHEQDRIRSRECGMNDHLAKPFDIEKLIRAINTQIMSCER